MEPYLEQVLVLVPYRVNLFYFFHFDFDFLFQFLHFFILLLEAAHHQGINCVADVHDAHGLGYERAGQKILDEHLTLIDQIEYKLLLQLVKILLIHHFYGSVDRGELRNRQDDCINEDEEEVLERLLDLLLGERLEEDELRNVEDEQRDQEAVGER